MRWFNRSARSLLHWTLDIFGLSLMHGDGKIKLVS